MAKRSTSGIPESIAKDLKLKGFKIHTLPQTLNISAAHGRRDFYKIGLVTGNMVGSHGDTPFNIHGTALFFVNPNVPHSVVRNCKKKTGYACLFTEAFIASRERTEILQNSPLFRFDGTPVILLNKEQAAFMTGLFQKMISVHSSNYHHKNELLRNCIEIIIHEALRIQPPQNEPQHKNGATRIAHLFTELLERQFPIDNTEQPLKLRTAKGFAESLAVHINYLNRAVKEVTGKPTSVHIANRIAAEAKALLLYTDWSIADIAYGLGFEYPTYFNNYFKRVTGITPNSLRKEKV
ncbi:MAG TPA: helix-turn-helix domain-containing protein [Bacteroidia bacterium]|jgi:AraC family transcriptional activator of pobA|nr:helix-turn-helix domain-containing protein [Bacteroidia bacterium]